MWKKLSNLPICETLTTTIRTYVPRGGNFNTSRQIKVVKGKMKTRKEPAIDEAVDIKLTEKDIKTSPEYIADPEGFGDFESDFMEAHKSHREYLSETKKHKEYIRHWIIKNKYFKEKLPNFLTYAEKEQIKLLNNRDPEEWTPEKLSESFPASPEIISKILKAKWIAHSEKRIKTHDENVIENWNLFKEGKFDNLNKELTEHLQKFANRTKEDLENSSTSLRVIPKLPTPKTSEFVNIITSCKKYTEKHKLLEEEKENDKEIELNDQSAKPKQDETFLMGKIFDKRKMRLEDFKNKKLNKIEQNNLNISINENLEDRGILKVQQENSVEKFKTSEIIISKEDMKTYEVDPIKEKIYIPRKLWKKGATYKVIDCYYDDDGEFLYRVPGMTGKRM